MMTDKRISALDGFRAVAIIAVMLYHYFSRWTPPNHNVSLYPYNGDYDYFEYGKLGVQFFFMISGFVIFFTLENTENMSLFWKKRLIRLVPSIVIASIITFIVFGWLDPLNIFPHSHEIKNLIPSITFVSPQLLNSIFDVDLNYINGSYWSLWPEIQFYLFVSTLYYLNKKRFVINFLSISFTLILVNYFFQHVMGSNKLGVYLPAGVLSFYVNWIENGFNLLLFISYFTIGVVFYLLYSRHKYESKTFLFISVSLVFLMMYIIYTGEHVAVRVAYLLIFVVFICFIYFPETIFFFENKMLTKIGESSYFLYLIHEMIGVLLIYSLGQYFMPIPFVLPLAVIAIFTLLSIAFAIYIDKPITQWLKLKLIN